MLADQNIVPRSSGLNIRRLVIRIKMRPSVDAVQLLR